MPYLCCALRIPPRYAGEPWPEDPLPYWGLPPCPVDIARTAATARLASAQRRREDVPGNKGSMR